MSIQIRTDINTLTHDLGNGFFIDVVDKSNEYEAYLYYGEHGVKSSIYAATKNAMDYTGFISELEKMKNQVVFEYMVEFM